MRNLPNNEMEQQWLQSHLSADSQAYLDNLYEAYLANPQALPEYWIEYFSKLPKETLTDSDTAADVDSPHASVREQFAEFAWSSKKLHAAATSSSLHGNLHDHKQAQVSIFIEAYRNLGHLKAKIDPLGLIVRTSPNDLNTNHYQFTDEDMDETYSVVFTDFPHQSMTLRDIVAALKTTYSDSIGAEYMHIPELEKRNWFQHQLESVYAHPNFNTEERLRIYKRLVAASGLEKYLASRYPGTKRFGLEGAESMIPMVDEMIQRLGSQGVKEIVMGMAHRGRLNVLVNIFGKNPADLFDEFEGKASNGSAGDVKYHQGFSSNVMTPGGEVHLALAFNPSHLEIVDPVVAGSVRARQDRRGDVIGATVVPIIFHGDASFSGQGVVMETFQMSNLRGYQTGGTIHIVINNQIGFTTSDKQDARSTRYCTDVAKIVNAPVIHVNGNDPEAVVFVAQLAVNYRNIFHADIVIDMYCYRRRGHNEADEPMATQPKMYQTIRNLETTTALYGKSLITQGILDNVQDTKIAAEYWEKLENSEHVTDSLVSAPDSQMFVDWRPYLNQPWSDDSTKTLVDEEKLRQLGEKIFSVPASMQLQKQVQKIMDDRNAMIASQIPLNWGATELLAYASILDGGQSIRFTGQDCRRGTFAHRHAVLFDQQDYAEHVLLEQAESATGKLQMYDSFLSEEAVLAFEYGYATTDPTTLVIWEAQFGDFVNGAQVVIDQFIAAGESKWMRLCGLVLLLPHGYEGQGAEHSSARPERFAQLCAENNMQLCVPTTAAQIFHLLRRQITRSIRKPLVIMSPKSLLRLKAASSPLPALSTDGFLTVIANIPSKVQPQDIKTVMICSGKVYYDLLEYRRTKGVKDVALVRIEQVYPFPMQRLEEIIRQYQAAATYIWVQEEPRNQGLWNNAQHWVKTAMHTVIGHDKLYFAGRPNLACPAVGMIKVHTEEQKQLIEDAFSISSK